MASMDPTEYIELGVIQRKQGLRGNLVVKLYDGIRNLGGLSSLFVRINHTLVPYGIERFFWQYRKTILKLKGVDDPKTAHDLQSRSVFVPQGRLSQFLPHKAHVDEILGYHVIDTKEGYLGTVKAIYDLPQQQILSVQYRDKELLIPYHKNLVVNINSKVKNVIVCLPKDFMKVAF